MRTLFCFLIILLMSLAFSTAALAQYDDDDDYVMDDDDSTSFNDSTVEVIEPTELPPDTMLLFSFLVTNMEQPGGGKGEWIYMVDLSMPSANYMVEEASLTAPDPLYPSETDRWEVSFDPNTVTISWQAMGLSTSVEYGDIREGDNLTFEFEAITDADATDGFLWTLFGDMGTAVSGVVYVTDGSDDDDDDSDDDDFWDDDDDEDQDLDDLLGEGDDDGCGC